MHSNSIQQVFTRIHAIRLPTETVHDHDTDNSMNNIYIKHNQQHMISHNHIKNKLSSANQTHPIM